MANKPKPSVPLPTSTGYWLMMSEAKYPQEDPPRRRACLEFGSEGPRQDMTALWFVAGSLVVQEHLDLIAPVGHCHFVRSDP